jgi:hypothetical protein
VIDVRDDRDVTQVHFKFSREIRTRDVVVWARCCNAAWQQPRRSNVLHLEGRRSVMPGKHTSKEKRKARHIENSYEKKGVSHREAEHRAWATVNKQD